MVAVLWMASAAAENPKPYMWTLPPIYTVSGARVSITQYRIHAWRPPVKRYGYFVAKVTGHENNNTLLVEFDRRIRPLPGVYIFGHESFVRLFEGDESDNYEIGKAYPFNGLMRLPDIIGTRHPSGGPLRRWWMYEQLNLKQFKERRETYD